MPLQLAKSNSVYSNKVCPSNLPFCFLLPLPVAVPILFLITFIHVNFQQSLQYVCKLMNICSIWSLVSTYVKYQRRCWDYRHSEILFPLSRSTSYSRETNVGSTWEALWKNIFKGNNKILNSTLKTEGQVWKGYNYEEKKPVPLKPHNLVQIILKPIMKAVPQKEAKSYQESRCNRLGKDA